MKVLLMVSLAVVLVVSGCLCCGGSTLGSDGDSQTQSTMSEDAKQTSGTDIAPETTIKSKVRRPAG
jgi:uncharacterized protein YceK